MTSGTVSACNPTTFRSGAEISTELPVEVADTIEACERLREPWLRLRASAGVQSPNTDPDRFLAVTAAMKACPHVVLLGPRESPRGMIIARYSRRRAVYRIGYARFSSPVLRALDVVYEGLLTKGEAGSFADVVRYLAECLRRRQFDVVSLNHLRSEQAKEVMELVHRTVVGKPDAHWRFALVPGSFDQTVARFSRDTRRRRQRADRHLVRQFGGKVSMRVFTRVDELDELIHRASEITRQSYHGRLGVGLLDNAAMRAMLTADARAGRLRWYWLEACGAPIAHDGGCIYGDTYHALAGSFLPQHRHLSPGHVLTWRIIQDLCAARVQWIDWGFGDAEYKRIYGTECWTEQSVHLYGGTAVAVVAYFAHRSALGIERPLSAIATWLGLRQWCRLLWRKMLQHTKGSYDSIRHRAGAR